MNKYKNIRTNGSDSRKEAQRKWELELAQRAGLIQELRFQVPFELIPKQMVDGKCVERSVKYIADFVYIKDGQLVVEDCKGFRTPEYIIKRKLMLYVHGIRIYET